MKKQRSLITNNDQIERRLLIQRQGGSCSDDDADTVRQLSSYLESYEEQTSGERGIIPVLKIIQEVRTVR